VSDHEIKIVYETHQVANLLQIGRSTVNKYARSMEEQGYVFMKDGKQRRSYIEHDLVVFRALVELLSKGVEYDSAIKSIVARYKRYSGSEPVAVIATSDSSYEIATLNDKLDKLIQVVSQLQHGVNEQIRSEVSELEQQIKEIACSVEQNNEKLDVALSRLEKHGKRKKIFRWF
jgi:predicted transcriptional regulator